MSTVSLGTFLGARGVELDEDTRKSRQHAKDSYDNAVSVATQCTGFVVSNNLGVRRVAEHLSDRCLSKTRHPSGRCVKHRRQER